MTVNLYVRGFPVTNPETPKCLWEYFGGYYGPVESLFMGDWQTATVVFYDGQSVVNAMLDYHDHLITIGTTEYWVGCSAHPSSLFTHQ